MMDDKTTRREFFSTLGAVSTSLAVTAGFPGILSGAQKKDDSAQGTTEMFSPKLALCNEMFEVWNTDMGFDFPRVLAFIKECGYDGVEIAPFTIEKNAFHITATRRVEIRREAKKTGLEIPGLHWLLSRTEGFYLTSPDPVSRRKTSDYFMELTRLCADLGGKYMVLGSPGQRNLLPGVTKEQAFDYAARVLEHVVPLLEKCDVKLVLEPLASKETNFLANSDEAVALLKKIGAPEQVSLMLDCKAMASEKTSIPDLIRRHKAYLSYFHLNDPNLQGPGMGDLDFVPIFRALKEVGYNGWLSVEVFDYTPGVEKLAQDSVAHVKKILAEVDGLL